MKFPRIHDDSEQYTSRYTEVLATGQEIVWWVGLLAVALLVAAYTRGMMEVDEAKKAACVHSDPAAESRCLERVGLKPSK